MVSLDTSHNAHTINRSSLIRLVFLAACACALWGSAIPVARIGFKLLHIDGNNPAAQMLFAGIRFICAGILIILGVGIHRGFGNLRKDFTVLHIKDAIVLGAIQTTAQYFFYYIGLAHATGVSTALVQGIGVFISILIAVYVFHMEKLTSNKLLGCIIGFGGLFLTQIHTFSHGCDFTFLGEGFVICATICNAFAAPLVRTYSKKHNAVLLCGEQFVFGGILLSIMGYFAGGRVVFTDTTTWLILAWLILVSSVAYGIWSYLLAHNNVSRVMIFKFLTPVFGLIFSLLLLGKEGYPLGFTTFIALGLICIGIIIVNYKKSA